MKILIALFLCLMVQLPMVSAASRGPNVRVGLVVKQFSAELSCDGDIAVVSAGKKMKLGSGKHFISVKKGRLQVSGKDMPSTQAYFSAANAKKPLRLNHKSYRGSLSARLNLDKKTLSVINTLPVEEYLYGVVAKEIIPLWPDEAVKAQAVASRSFVLFKLQNSGYEGFDIRANEMGQVYGGIAAEHVNTNKLIDATNGVVVLYNGRPIEAFFHSCSGGYTESSVNVWGSSLPFLQAVKDYDEDAPKFFWEKTFTREQLQRNLEQAGYRVGTLDTIRLSPRKPAPMKAQDRGVSGRVKSLTFRGTQGSVTIEGTKLRSILQLNSTLFDISVGLNRPDFIEVPILDVYGREIGRKRIPIKVEEGKNKGSLGSAEVRYLSSVAGEKIFFNGNGWGHGLGMSQWGARGMALAAPKQEKNYYRKILQHYYTGTTVEKVY